MLCVLGILVLLSSSGIHAFDPNVPQTFDALCKRDSSGYPADSDIVNCWGFETDEELFYHDPLGTNSPCKNANGSHILADHPNGISNPVPYLNAGVNTTTCLHPERVTEFSTSGTHSIKVVQVDYGGGNSGGTFRPYFKHYIGADGKQKFAGFGAGGELWIHWRYRQNNELFQYHSKRFMVTHKDSTYEHVLIAVGTPGGGRGDPPYKYLCAYNYKGALSYGCSDTLVYEANKWHTFVMHIKIPDVIDDQAGTSNGLFELFMDGQRVVHAPNFRNSPCCGPAYVGAYNDALDFETQHDLNVLMRLDFLLFENGKTGTGSRPMGAMYIDDVVVSRKQLPTILPSGDRDNLPPSPPQGLTAN